MRALVCVGVLAACGGDDTPPIDVSCKPIMVYLNRNGGSYDKASADDAAMNKSMIIDGPRTLAPWPNADWTELAACVRAGLAQFPRIEVTETDPGNVPHLEIVFTDVYWVNTATTMVVPALCRENHQVEFVFGDAFATTTRACHVTLQGFAQMTALLSLNDNCLDFVNNFQDCSPERSFVDTTANCVNESGQPTPCRCCGTTENTYEALGARFPSCD